MDFSELSHQTEIRDSLDKILSEHCSQERLKKYDANFKHDEDLLSLLSTNGFLGLGLNEKYGGSGEDLIAYLEGNLRTDSNPDCRSQKTEELFSH